MTITKKDILAANQYGLKNCDYASWHSPILQTASDLGCDGVDLSDCEIVTGWRRGGIPEGGLSTNWREQESENGLSLMGLEGDEAHWSEMFMGDREKVIVKGLLLPFTGSDDEKLVLPIDCIENLDA